MSLNSVQAQQSAIDSTAARDPFVCPRHGDNHDNSDSHLQTANRIRQLTRLG